MDFRVPPELEEVRSSFKAFLEREVAPVEERYRQHIQDDEWTDEMRDAALQLRRKSAEIGYYGAHLPEDVGGWGLSVLGMTLLIEAAAQSGYRMADDERGDAAGRLLLRIPRRRSLRLERRQALHHPDAGSDAQAIRTRAVPSRRCRHVPR